VADRLLAIDQGTTSTRAIVFDAALAALVTSQREFPQIYPGSGLVEHDPEQIWETALSTAREALAGAGAQARDVAAIGITNQRETTIIWDRATGRPIHHAIVWQDRRTADVCAALRDAGHEPMIAQRTGLLLDPYFSATKIAWLLDRVEGARAAAQAGRLAFGTVDTFLLWRLTGGAVHATDATNAARTLLFDIREGCWDADLCRLFGVPMALLPEVRDSAGDFGVTAPGLFGDVPVVSNNRLLTTIAYQLDGKRTYALEGAIFIAGASVQWLRDALKVIGTAPDVNGLAAAADPDEQVYLVPAFVGLGAPWWDAEARGAVFGLTRKSGVAELARAALEAVGYQTRDLLDAMRADWPARDADTVLRVDGGMTASDVTMQFLADILPAPVDRPAVMETTALGAAYLAGRAAGICPDLDGFAATWRCERRFSPQMDAATRDRKWAGWQDAVRRTRTPNPSEPQ
jgi:glycerol kinase